MEKMYERIMSRHGGVPISLGEVCTGIASEGGEVVEEWRKHCYESKPLYNGNVVNEMGDVLHYLVLGCVYYGLELDDLMRVNAAKMDAIDAGERDVFDSFLSNWDANAESLDHRLEQWDDVLKILKESRETYVV